MALGGLIIIIDREDPRDFLLLKRPTGARVTRKLSSSWNFKVRQSGPDDRHRYPVHRECPRDTRRHFW